jgi:hypothetical protein
MGAASSASPSPWRERKDGGGLARSAWRWQWWCSAWLKEGERWVWARPTWAWSRAGVGGLGRGGKEEGLGRLWLLGPKSRKEGKSL